MANLKDYMYKRASMSLGPGPKPTPKPASIKNEVGFIDSTLNANKDKPWVKRLYDKNPQTITLKGSKEPSTHLMASADRSVFPTIDVDKRTGKLVDMGDTAFVHHIKNNTDIRFKTPQEAQWFGENYKKGTGVLPKTTTKNGKKR